MVFESMRNFINVDLFVLILASNIMFFDCVCSPRDQVKHAVALKKCKR